MGAAKQTLQYEGLDGLLTIVEKQVTDRDVGDAILNIHESLSSSDFDMAYNYYDEGKSIAIMLSPEHYGIFEDILTWLVDYEMQGKR